MISLECGRNSLTKYSTSTLLDPNIGALFNRKKKFMGGKPFQLIWSFFTKIRNLTEFETMTLVIQLLG